MEIAIYVTLSMLGTWFGRVLNLPMPAFLGALIAVAVWQILTVIIIELNKFITFFIQTLLGIVIALSFTQFDFKELKRQMKGILIINFL